MFRIKNLYENIVKTITQILIEVGSINKSDFEIYYFSLYEGGIFIFNIFLTLIIANLVQSIWIGIVFLLALFPVRRFAGGYHAKTRGGCLFFSIFVVVFAMNGIKIMDKLIFSYKVLLLIFCAFSIFMLSPVPTDRKRLSDVEMSVYRKKLFNVLGLEVITGILIGNCGLDVFTATILAALLVCLVIICLGKFTRYNKEK